MRPGLAPAVAEREVWLTHTLLPWLDQLELAWAAEFDKPRRRESGYGGGGFAVCMVLFAIPDPIENNPVLLRRVVLGNLKPVGKELVAICRGCRV